MRTALFLLETADLVIFNKTNAYMKKMTKVLQPFKAVTTELSAEKYVSASKILPLARGLQKVTKSTGGACVKLCEKLITQMTLRFANMEDKGVEQ